MSTAKSIRESIDGALDKWQAKAEAMEAQVEASKEQVSEKFEASKQKYLEFMDKLKEKVSANKELSQERAQALHTKIDEARVQIALGKADTADAIEAQTKVIKTKIREVEEELNKDIASFDKKLNEGWSQIMENLVKASDVFEADLDAAGARLTALKSKASGELKESKEEIKKSLAEIKEKIAEERKNFSESTAAFDTEFSEGWNKIVGAFKGL